jgi:hypothetical protein
MLVNFKISYKPAIFNTPEQYISPRSSNVTNKVCSNSTCTGLAVTEGDCHRLPTAATWVQPQVRSCDIYGGQSDTGTGFHRVPRLPSPILIPPTVPRSLTIPLSTRRLWIPEEVGCRLQEGVPPYNSGTEQEKRLQENLDRRKLGVPE